VYIKHYHEVFTRNKLIGVCGFSLICEFVGEIQFFSRNSWDLEYHVSGRKIVQAWCWPTERCLVWN